MASQMEQRLSLDLSIERFAYREPFRISGHVFESTTVLVARLSDGEDTGWGEGAGAYYLGDDAENMLRQAEDARSRIESGASRQDLQQVMPAGGARNAIDCAYWDLEAKRSHTPAWQLAGLPEPQPLRSTLTLGAAEPDEMAAAALRLDPAAPIKVKLTGDTALDIRRINAVRDARPDAWIGVDANQGYRIDALPELLAALVAARVELLEQPLAIGHEADLDGFDRPIPFAADESALGLADVEGLVGRFDVVNIKLDKCGGLTEGIAIARRAKALGMGVMVGNMMGTSLSMAPSYLLGQLCDIVDLDGPTFLTRDRPGGVTYSDGKVHCDTAIWGGSGKMS
ncbi:dipeptide epimerase [Croceibacterium aestuarii]|uniref:dipeptide epimerase n=1 Tax=Croceibacterium aestuarii TaxID=3064139 RepID=UPI00272ED4AC|nr:dipeptide epimerase [Croceibacterium sp. D39]